MGLFYPHHARDHDGVSGRCLVAQFSEYLCHAAFDVGICQRPYSLKHRNEPGRSWRYARDRNRLSIIFFCLWPYGPAVPFRAFFIRDLARHFRKRVGAPLWPGLGMVHLAASRAHLAVCGCSLSCFDASKRDAMDFALLATVLCF